VLVDENLAARAAELGEHLLAAVRDLNAACVADIRGRGLLIGIEIRRAHGTARQYCEDLARRGVLAKDTHEQVIRLAPPLIVTRAELDGLVTQLRAVLR
jgi:ornithine--oxo-acid transaminase